MSAEESDVQHEKGVLANSPEEVDQPINISQDGEFPEGGLDAWKTVTGAFLIQVCGFGYTTSYGVYQDYFVRKYILNESASTISWTGSINSWFVMIGGLFSGRLYDKGYFYHIMMGGSLLISFSLFMLSLAQPNHWYQVFLSFGVGHGMGAGILYIPSLAVISHYFKRRRHLAMTIVATGSSIGAIIHPIMLNNLLNNTNLGFGNSVRLSAAMNTVLLLAACLLMRTRLPTPKQSVNFWKVASKALKDPVFMLATLGMCVFIVGFYWPLFYIQLQAISHGVNPTFAFYSLVILNFASLCGRLLAGFTANRLGVQNLVAVSTLGGAVMVLSTIGLSSVASVVLIAALFGFFAGTFVALMAPLLAMLTSDLSELGARMGLSFAVISIAGLIGSPIEGALLVENGRYVWWRPAVFSGTIAMTGFFLICAMIVLLKRRNRKALASEKTSSGA